MLLKQMVNLKWNSKNKKHYVDLGYNFTKMGDEFSVDVNDLTKGSNVKVRVKCDYCGDIYEVAWYSYYNLKQKENNKDCCGHPQCTGQKAKESLMLLHSVDNARKIEGVNEKIIKTNLDKYGCANPFANEQIKAKIKHTNLEKYGVEVPTQNPVIREKGMATCLERYGSTCYGVIYSREHKGELSPTWKGGVSYHRVERSTYEYRHWRKSVFDRDLYACQCCGAKSGIGNKVELNAHHIKNWKDNTNLRYDINNGITLCDKCHTDFHSKYGKKNNTEQQLKEFLNNNSNIIDKKVC